MEVVVKGILIECVKTKSKDGLKDYFSANVYSEGKLYRVGLPLDKYIELKEYEGQEVVINGISFWCSGQYSLYVKDNNE